MSSSPELDETLRQAILARPDAILEDPDVMQALVAANERAMGSNIVDLRAIAMERLETRLGRLEDTHRSVIAAAYDNLAGTNQIHRAILRLLEPGDFEGFLRNLRENVADILCVDAVTLVLESQPDPERDEGRLADVLMLADPGTCAGYVAGGRGGTPRQVTLRAPAGSDLLPDSAIHGQTTQRIRSEACLLLDLGKEHLPGMLVLGASDAELFSPDQGTDLLGFFTGVFERVLRRWLA